MHTLHAYESLMNIGTSSANAPVVKSGIFRRTNGVAAAGRPFYIRIFAGPRNPFQWQNIGRIRCQRSQFTM
ncbi:unnamed protein product [Nesidiocoris tenuis]|uniref:Uncharacterized protein n=1 Tax=Nesidiocoris tenuis TaxID=355587 RepID=A0A6H5G3Z5_9HEMI|nr:unnamed protein product [Nesidiocoris tenuis]